MDLAKYKIIDNPYSKTLKGVGRREMYRIFAEHGCLYGAEIGVQRGRNAAVMFECIPGLHLIAVDPYKNHKYGRGSWGVEFLNNVRRETHSRLANFDVTYIELFSEQASWLVDDESLDFVYIDADHSYDFCMLDILMWSRKVKHGGIISGHDFHGSVGGVKQAVVDYASSHKMVIYSTDGKRKDREKGDRFPSWFLVKN